MMDRKDHIISTLTQLNDDLRNKLVNLSADAGMQLAAKDEQIAKLTEALKRPPAANGHGSSDAASNIGKTVKTQDDVVTAFNPVKAAA